ncbi:MAG: hypothetical protein L0H41_17755 [Microlunatus sp.]|nr:hypothetical protein [Microlunatus sp.]MDN5769719.1 hypothetical protein [Microlunatus sp.]
MSDDSAAELRARIAELENENADLRTGATTVVESRSAPPRRSRGRMVVAVVMILLGVLLAPVAVVTGWAKWTLTDTDRFVATYAPLAESPAVQTYVVSETMKAVDEKVDLNGLTQQLVDGLIKLGTGPRATQALRALQGPAATGLRSLVQDGVTTFVQSDQFANVFAQTLRATHRQLDATLGNDPDAVLTLGSDGTLGIELGPIIARVRDDLIERGITVATRIPEVNREIVLVQSDQLPAVQVAYGLTIAIGTWLPWAVLALLIGGVLVAHRRSRATVAAAGGFALVMALLAVLLAVGRVAALNVVPASVLPGTVTGLFYDTATTAMRSTAIAAAVIGVAVALVAWLGGPSRTPIRLRSVYGAGVGYVRDAAEHRGLSTGKVGVWLHRRRLLLFALIAVVAALVLVLNHPISLGLIGWTVFWSVLAVVVVTLVERPDPSDALATAPTIDHPVE